MFGARRRTVVDAAGARERVEPPPRRRVVDRDD
jgi:hypothetical protein